jgi:hypothetical protein
MDDIFDEEIRRKQIQRVIRSLEGGMRAVSHVMTVSAESNGSELKQVEHLIEKWVDERLLLRSRKNSDNEELEFILKGLDRFSKLINHVVSERRVSIARNGKAIDFSEAKYKMKEVSEILDRERQTVNNWSNSRGGYLRTFEFPGVSKFSLESDLIKKYEELYGRTLVIDKEFREKYEYKPNPKMMKNVVW